MSTDAEPSREGWSKKTCLAVSAPWGLARAMAMTPQPQPRNPRPRQRHGQQHGDCRSAKSLESNSAQLLAQLLRHLMRSHRRPAPSSMIFLWEVDWLEVSCGRGRRDVNSQLQLQLTGHSRLASRHTNPSAERVGIQRLTRSRNPPSSLSNYVNECNREQFFEGVVEFVIDVEFDEFVSCFLRRLNFSIRNRHAQCTCAKVSCDRDKRAGRGQRLRTWNAQRSKGRDAVEDGRPNPWDQRADKADQGAPMRCQSLVGCEIEGCETKARRSKTQND